MYYNNQVKTLCLLTASLFLTACNGYQLPLDIAYNQEPNYCWEQFYQQNPPDVQKANLKKLNYALCYHGFSMVYSGVSKTPLWVAEHLTPTRLSTPLKRQDNFHEEERIDKEHRSLLTDYRGSGFDRGHMAPNGDMFDEQSQYDSFALTNMVPQHPKNNQNIWREIEEATRAMVRKQQQEVYVITGPLFEKKQLQVIGSGVLVPTAVFKAVYYPKLGVVSAYYTPNDDSQRYEIISICALEQKAGINLFPKMNQDMKREIYNLPLNANAVKSNRIIELKAIDRKSTCANPVSDAELEWQKQQFKWENFKTLRYSTMPQGLFTETPPEQTVSEQVVNKALLKVVRVLKDE